MWLPTKVYKSLPLLYVTIGALLLLGALYIGVGYGLMPGYVTIGLLCIIAGTYVTYIRWKARSLAAPRSARTDRPDADLCL